ncbi:MAG: UDP-N-acetylmuramate dehydrogenase [Lachnospiraceae bacterium]|nr:UDP-N-acetylmuramate dehydrogenase [Lachnospiraceae bacterium]
MNAANLEYLKQIIPEENIRLEEPMSRHTTFRTGGNAEVFLQIDTQEQLGTVIKFLNKIEEHYFLLGNGSNLLVSDDGYEGIMLSLGSEMSCIRIAGNQIFAQAGALLSQMARAAYEAGLTGLEFAAGIPGSVGGAAVMNAGAYGGEMKQIVTKVRVMSREGEIMELDNESMEFGYRTSAIRNHGFIVLDIVAELSVGDREAINATMLDLAQKRREKQPLEYPSAGSTFKRPEGHFAGKLIMDAGLRGYRVGDACVSEKHCGFVVNLGHATSKDIWQLIKDVQEKVFLHAGIQLETEVIPLGKFQ